MRSYIHHISIPKTFKGLINKAVLTGVYRLGRLDNHYSMLTGARLCQQRHVCRSHDEIPRRLLSRTIHICSSIYHWYQYCV